MFILNRRDLQFKDFIRSILLSQEAVEVARTSFRNTSQDPCSPTGRPNVLAVKMQARQSSQEQKSQNRGPSVQAWLKRPGALWLLSRGEVLARCTSTCLAAPNLFVSWVESYRISRQAYLGGLRTRGGPSAGVRTTSSTLKQDP